MTRPIPGVELAVHTEAFVVSPLTAGCPVHSIQCVVLSVVAPPLVMTQAGSVEPVAVFDVLVAVGAATKTRSLPARSAPVIVWLVTDCDGEMV